MDLATQSYYAFLDTYNAVQSCRKNNFSLSFTGYGFGAWLAEQSVLFARKDFKFHDVKAVTFESPGSFEYLNILNETNVINRNNYFDLNSLDITTYLSSPNFVNTCNKHLGKVFRIFPEKQIEIKQIIHEIIKMIPKEKIRDKTKKCFEDNIIPNINEYNFYLTGIISLFSSDGIDLFINEFKIEKDKPKIYKTVLDWPKVEFRPSKDFHNNYAGLFDAKNLIPFSDAIPQAAVGLVNTFKNAILNRITSKYLEGVKVIINLLMRMNPF
jgi:hypothetical protein